MTRSSALLATALIVAACGAGPDPAADPGTTTEPPSTLPASPSTTSPADGVVVTVTATPVQQPDGSVELCPPGTTGGCPGIALAGDIDPALLGSEGTPTVIQVTGLYDGGSLTPDSDPVIVDHPPFAESDLSSLCPDLEPLATPYDDALTTAVSGYTTGNPDYALMWWNEDGSALTVWFKGEDVSEHQAAIDALAGGKPVCVAGGAEFSESELLEASQLLSQFRDSRGLPLTSSGWGFGRSNQIELYIEELDADTRSALSDLVGDRVVIVPFMELLDASLTELPDPLPKVPGDVEILTNNVRAAGGMAALGHFTVNYDPDLNCIFFAEAGSDERIVPVWPFGYSATRDPMTVYDFDGNPVATEGDQIELGGGNVGLSGIEGNTCGATSTWIVS